MNVPRTALGACLSLGAMALSTLDAFSYSVKDARGEVFDFDAPPRVATIVPSITQSIYALGAQDNLIANSTFCVYPAEASKKVKIGNFLNPDYEKIAELKPDIFLLPTLKDERIESRLKKLGVRAFVLNREGLSNICDDVRILGKLFQKEAEAEKIVSQIERAINGEKIKLRAFFMFGNMAAGKGSFVGDILTACGLENCADATGKAWSVPSREFILSSRPEIIFAESVDSDDEARMTEFFKSDPAWSSTPAVKSGAIFYIRRELAIIPSVGVIEIIGKVRDFAKSCSQD